MTDENGCGPHRKGKVHAVAKTVSEKEKRSHGPVISRHIKDAFGICFSAVNHVAVVVHGAHRFFGVAAAVKPESRIIGGGCGRLKIRACLFEQFLKRKMIVTLRSANHNRFQEDGLIQNLFNFR